MQFVGDWTQADKDKLTNATAAVAKRLQTLKADFSKAVAKLSECEKSELKGAIDAFEDLLQKMIEGHESNTPVYIYQENRSGGTDVAPARTYPAVGLYSDRLYFNNGTSPGWHDMNNQSLNQLVFHELSHIEGTIDSSGGAPDDPNKYFTDAHVLDDFMNGTLEGSSWWMTMTRKARERCAKKKQPCPLKNGGEGRLPVDGDGTPFYILFL